MALIDRHASTLQTSSSINFFIEIILSSPPPLSFSQWLMIDTTPVCVINASWKKKPVTQKHIPPVVLPTNIVNTYSVLWSVCQS